MSKEKQTTHVLIRTSPKGGPFLGRCSLCGATNLKSSAVFDSCPNPHGVSEDQSLLDAIEDEDAGE